MATRAQLDACMIRVHLATHSTRAGSATLPGIFHVRRHGCPWTSSVRLLRMSGCARMDPMCLCVCMCGRISRSLYACMCVCCMARVGIACTGTAALCLTLAHRFETCVRTCTVSLHHCMLWASVLKTLASMLHGAWSFSTLLLYCVYILV